MRGIDSKIHAATYGSVRHATVGATDPRTEIETDAATLSMVMDAQACTSWPTDRALSALMDDISANPV